MADIPTRLADAGVRILFLEDSDDDVELMVRGLRREVGPVSFSRVETPEGLRRAAPLGPWDLVISDHSMPRLALGGAVELLREAGPVPPILVVSGHLDRTVEEEALRAGASDCFPKSDLPRVVAAAGRLLAGRGAASRPAPLPVAWSAVPDEALRDAAVAGRNEAWAEVRRRFRPAILAGAARGLRGCGGRVQAAEVEETECRVWARLFSRGARNLRLWDPERGGLRARLYGLAEREGWSQARRERRRAAGSRPPEVLAILPSRRDEDPGKTVLADELADLTRVWLAFRPPEEARLLELRAAGRSLSEIAEETGLSRSKVQRRLAECERDLRRRLAAWGWDPPPRRSRPPDSAIRD